MADPMEVYNQIKAIGPEAKSEADAFMQELTHKYTQDHPAPPELLQQGLNSILSKYSKHDQHAKASHSVSGNSDRGTYLTGLLGTLGAAAGFAAGMPAIGLAGILLASTSLLSKYQTNQKETAHEH